MPSSQTYVCQGLGLTFDHMTKERTGSILLATQRQVVDLLSALQECPVFHSMFMMLGPNPCDI